MYKLLLSWRYLKTRFIALASIVSVTLGVATLIVVNSVMAGFVEEMQGRLHGILSDVELDAGFEQIHYPEIHARQISEAIGDDLKAITYVVRVPALMNFRFGGRQWNQQVMLMGVDQRTYGDVTDFQPYLMNENNSNEVSFELQSTGYDSKLGECGWTYRKEKFEHIQQLERLMQQYESAAPSPGPSANSNQSFDLSASNYQPPGTGSSTGATKSETEAGQDGTEIVFPELPDEVDFSDSDEEAVSLKSKDEVPAASSVPTPFDSRSDMRRQLTPDEMFNPARDQYTGVILGYAISNRKFQDPETGETRDVFMVRPGDDVQVTLPTAGNTSAVTENLTVVDFYHSNMHEYDASFVFMPLRKLQEIRKMIEPLTGAASVNTIQIKLRDGANLNEVRDKLRATFPNNGYYPFTVQTWQDQQRPLLSAVNMELTILNILLFLIIAVAGFGILATFFMIVVEKTKDIGVLKALGAPSRGVMSIFLGYGVSLGAVGTGVGILMGLAFVYYINDIANGIQWITGQEIFDPTIYYFSEIPTLVNPLMIVWVALGAIGIAVLASVLPALRAARLHPVEALRYE